MIKIILTTFTVLTLGLIISSCEKMEPQILAREAIDLNRTMEDIPLQYGRLVSATASGPFRAVLWFEQTDRTIIGVSVNVSRATITEDVIRFERK